MLKEKRIVNLEFYTYLMKTFSKNAGEIKTLQLHHAERINHQTFCTTRNVEGCLWGTRKVRPKRSTNLHRGIKTPRHSSYVGNYCLNPFANSDTVRHHLLNAEMPPAHHILYHTSFLQNPDGVQSLSPVCR